MSEPLKEAAVSAAHADVLAAVSATEAAIQKLMLLTPEAPKPEGAKPEDRAPRMFTRDMVRSAGRIADFLADTRLHALVVAQEIMQFTEEAREAALAAQAGRFKIVDGPKAEGGPDAPQA